MLTKIYADNPSEKELDRVADLLRHDGVVVYPTDGVYAIGCALDSAKAIARLGRIKGSAEHSVSFGSLKQIAEYCRVDNQTFRTLKANLPGAFTFILNASSRVPSKTLGKRKTLGVRMPDNAIFRALVDRLGCPIASVSVREDEEEEYMTDPSLIEERYHNEVDCVIDGGTGSITPSTVVDLTGAEAEILREGRGELI